MSSICINTIYVYCVITKFYESFRLEMKQAEIKRKREERHRLRMERQQVKAERREMKEKKKLRKIKNNLAQCNYTLLNCYTHDNAHWRTPPLWHGKLISVLTF